MQPGLAVATIEAPVSAICASFRSWSFRRHFRLCDVIDAGATAAPGRFGQFDEIDAGNRVENLPRLSCDLLPVAQMTCLMVGDGKFPDSPRRACGFRKPDSQSHSWMSRTFADHPSPRGILRVVRQVNRKVFRREPQPAAFVMIASSASSSKAHRSVSGRAPSHFHVAVVRVQGTATILHGGVSPCSRWRREPRPCRG